MRDQATAAAEIAGFRVGHGQYQRASDEGCDVADSWGIQRVGQGRDANAATSLITHAAGVCRAPVYNREKWTRYAGIMNDQRDH
ncbi:MAG: hypothetical protein RL261_2189 [Pseudomonadota bacterium]|jgi:hypothetical protein